MLGCEPNSASQAVVQWLEFVILLMMLRVP